MMSASLTCCATSQQPVVPDIVKVGSQVKIKDARLRLDNCLGYSLDRVVCCPLGPISKRSRLEIRLEDRFEYELEFIASSLFGGVSR